ncbi:MAG: hypothetical protein PSV35_01055, partial [bacterium]|nr:hypothetical protein [bacterium]
LPQQELISALKSPYSFYHRLLQIPLKNVLNGIILEQANDYHVYAQKLFIDYLLSGESAKGEDAQGAGTRESLEEERKALVVLGEDFNKTQLEHNSLIARSQSILIKITKEWREAFDSSVSSINATLKTHSQDIKLSLIKTGINHALINLDLSYSQYETNHIHFVDKMNEMIKFSSTTEIKEKLQKDLSKLLHILSNFDQDMAEFLEQVDEMNAIARKYREQFYQSILRVTFLINLLPDYRIDLEQDIINRSSLQFDKTIGDSGSL